MKVSGRAARDDPRRPIELIAFTTAYLENMPYPARAEFVYGEWLRDMFEAGTLPQPESDLEYTVLLTQARQTPVALLGPPSRYLLPAVSVFNLRAAIGDARTTLLANMVGDERNVLLTLARMWCTLQTGKIVPKDVAAQWALPRLSGAAAGLMERARLAYLGAAVDDWSDAGSDLKDATQDLSERIATLLQESV